ncbi:MAG TPA: ATP-binding protein [Planctomycetaceae bacterium]|nr:ATP-binding protein [Planctomycetaceae bacterium]
MSDSSTIPSVEQYEKLASFYLGRQYDLQQQQLKDDLVMYDAKDLCTHAMCVGMTGSGKTGLCLSLLEEAAIDGVPVICVDPKGDLANLLLTFPDLKPEDFRPWLEAGEASRKGVTLDELAATTAQRWRSGLASWGQTPDRIARFRDSADIAIYTPGSNAGLPLTVLRSFDAPPAELLDDPDVMRERITGAASGLLTLMGIQADPLLSPEHILISSILDHCWRQGRNVSVADLIGLIQRPPIKRVGVLDLDSFMPPAERARIAMQLNNLLASPAFSTWLEGDSLSIKRLLYTPEGKPRISILSIAHLTDTERMFFLTILLNELLAWMRTQSGTSSLRALFYMDEVAGYFPPVSNPPCKPPMLTLLKQARAFGLGITLATQNPMDLDYKGLSNIGTWFIGRLQTDRDKARVLDGLEGASVQNGSAFDRRSMETLLSALGNRVFLMNNVHDDGPTLFQSRWALSFLAGPLARGQISQLMAGRKAAASQSSESSDRDTPSPKPIGIPSRPVVPAGITEKFASPFRRPHANSKLLYRPSVLGTGSLHYIRAAAGIDQWLDYQCLMPCERGVPRDAWESAVEVDSALDVASESDSEFEFSELPNELASASNFKKLTTQFKDYLYRHHSLTIYRAPELGKFAPVGLSEGEARIHFTQDVRELRDRETEKIRAKYASKAQTLEKSIRAAAERLDRQRSELNQASVSSVITLGTSVLGAFFGNKTKSRSSNKTDAIIRGATQTAKKKADADRAEEAMRQLSLDLEDLQTSIKLEIDELARKYDVHKIQIEATEIPPRKSDIKIEPLVLVWLPWQIDQHGEASPLYSTSER